MSPLVEVAGRLLTAYEFSVLEELAGGPDTARSVGVNIGPDGWSALRALTSLERRGLVERFRQGRDLAWRLTDDGRQPFGS